MSLENIYLIVGESGSGKTSVANKLEEDYGLKQVWSYTTRPQRYEGETGHIFVTDEEFDALGPLCAYTEYNGYRYGVTDKVVDESDIYVIDPDGVKYMESKYQGRKAAIVPIRLLVNDRDRIGRMLDRGDAPWDIQRRLVTDRKKFGMVELTINYFLKVPNRNLDKTVECIAALIRCCEPELEERTIK